MLLLGGFAIAAALSKHALAKRGATWILARVGGRPSTVLLTNMLVGAPAKAQTATGDKRSRGHSRKEGVPGKRGLCGYCMLTC